LGDAFDYDRLSGPQRKVLRGALGEVFPSRGSFDMFLSDKDEEPLGNIVPEGGYTFQLFEFIKHHGAQGRLKPIIKSIRAEFPDSPAVIDLDAKLALVSTADARTQRVAEKQGGLERVVRDSGEQDLYLWAEKLLTLARRICRIRYPVAAGILYGTGFLIGPDLVLTNHHVIEPLFKGQAKRGAVAIRFDYAEHAADRDEGIDFALDEKWLVRSSPYSEADLAVDAGEPADDELDYAVIRLAKDAGRSLGRTGVERGWIDLDDISASIGEDQIVFILQHPDGEPIKQTIGLTKAGPSKLRLRYDADTESGSSGALVVTSQLQPVALHHAGDPDSKTKARYNQGIPLELIRAALADLTLA
jgi:Trypsin-like peptidase domain/Effector-associated domain 1